MTPYIIRITFPKMSSKILKPFSKKMSNHFSKYLSPINQFSLGHYSMGGENYLLNCFFFSDGQNYVQAKMHVQFDYNIQKALHVGLEAVR